MKIRNLFIVLLALLIVGGLFIYARTRPDDARGVVTIWCVDGGTATDEVADLADEYNASISRATLPVEITRFASEAEMATALESGTPDIIICSHYRAFDMHSRGILADVSASLGKENVEYPMVLSSRNPCIGSEFFPIGIRAQVLVANPELFGNAEMATMEELSAAAQAFVAENGTAFYALDSYAALFFTELLREGEEFDAALIEKPTGAYKALYNLLAEGAFTGALSTCGEDAVARVRSGALACAIVSSDALRAEDARALEVYPVPPLSEGNDSGYLGEAWGLAVTAGGSRSMDDIAAFISWLFANDRGAKLGLQCGLIPAQSGAYTSHNSLWRALTEVYQGKIAALPTGDTAFAQGRNTFEQEFCDRLRFLCQ